MMKSMRYGRKGISCCINMPDVRIDIPAAATWQFLMMLSHYKRIDLAFLVCYSYSRNKVSVGGGVYVKYDSSKGRR